jgi:anti-sigma B factor antagonist
MWSMCEAPAAAVSSVWRNHNGRATAGDDPPLGATMTLDGSEITPGRRDGEPATLRVWGEVDVVNADELHRAIVEASKHARSPVVLDATGIRFIDAAGLRAMHEARAEIERAGHRLIVRPSRSLQRLMDLTGIAFDRA